MRANRLSRDRAIPSCATIFSAFAMFPARGAACGPLVDERIHLRREPCGRRSRNPSGREILQQRSDHRRAGMAEPGRSRGDCAPDDVITSLATNRVTTDLELSEPARRSGNLLRAIQYFGFEELERLADEFRRYILRGLARPSGSPRPSQRSPAGRSTAAIRERTKETVERQVPPLPGDGLAPDLE